MGLSIQGRVSFPLAVLVLVATASSAWAQAGTARVFGDVKDQQGAALPGAAVTLTSADTGATRAAVTSETGHTGSSPSPQQVLAEGGVDGIPDRPHRQSATGRRYRDEVRVGLALGSVTETVEVAATSPILNTTDASLGNVISGIQIQQLPLEARNPVGLLSLQAGAVYLPSGDQRSGSVSGAAAISRTSRSTAWTSTIRSGATPTTR